MMQRKSEWRIMGLCLTAVLTISGISASSQADTDKAVPDVWRAMGTVTRDVPMPDADHPGNVFLEDETLTVPTPKDMPEGIVRWRMLDDKDATVVEGVFEEASTTIEAGSPGIGWYRVEYLDESGDRLAWTTAAVIAKLVEAVPQDSPICVDSATAWFARNDVVRQDRFAGLAALAGVNWIRDRMSWGEVETARGTFAAKTSYDTSADTHARHGLKALQVFHSTPDWAATPSLDGEDARGRFPRDLRDQFNFCNAMAKRYQGRVQAWEPWNEANITPFGGHTIDEMASLQKAAYLGFKMGDPEVIVCWNVFAGSGSALHTEGVLLNEAWPYFETYNIHSYSTPDSYCKSFDGPRQAASGRPLWITECGIRCPHRKDDSWGEMGDAGERRQAEFIAHSYASSLYGGVNRHFFFILGNYLERGIQFGLLRRDETPRPGYSALAAVGRFLAGAQTLGRLRLSDTSDARVYAFRARPDGQECDVLVAWANTSADCPSDIPSLNITAAYDYFGRVIPNAVPAQLNTRACFLLLAPGEIAKLDLELPPARVPYREGTSSPVVLQVQMPQTSVRLDKQAYEIAAGQDVEIPLYAYNFGTAPQEGTLTIERTPESYHVKITSEPISLAAFEQKQVILHAHIQPSPEMLPGEWITLRGDFGTGGKPVLAFRLCSSIKNLTPTALKEITSARDVANWQDNIVAGATMSHHSAQTDNGQSSGVEFEMQFGESDPWAYPRLQLTPDEIPDDSFLGLTLTVALLEGKGEMRVQFIEENGAAYITSIEVQDDIQEPQTVTALFSDASWGPYSAQDPDGNLQPEKIRTILVGINGKRNSSVKMCLCDLAWVKY